MKDFSLMGHKGYKLAFEKWRDIKSKLDEAEAALQKLLFEGKPESVKTQRGRQVQAILSGVEPDTIAAGEKWREDIQKATERRNLFIFAEGAQKEKLSEERIKASKKICENISPMYKDIVKRLALQFIELGNVIVEERNLREALNEQGVAFSSHVTPMPISTIGNPEDANSRFAIWIIEACKNKYLEFRLVPRMFREKWYRSSGFRFIGDNLRSIPYSELQYFKNMKGKTVDVVLDNVRKDEKPESKSV